MEEAAKNEATARKKDIHTSPLELPGLVGIGSRQYAGRVTENASQARRMRF